jgi:hypothetical protein
MNISMNAVLLTSMWIRRRAMRDTSRSPSKTMSILRPTRTSDVIAGAIRARVVSIARRKRALRPTIFLQQTSEVNKMEYLIAFGVVSVMALYALVIARCLKEPEWQ